MTKAIAWFSAAIVLAACGGKAKVVPVAKKPLPGKIGAACKPSGEGLTQGSCEKELLCMPALPGGYCTKLCPCGEGAACMESSTMPEMCAKSCTSDDQCRGKQGYVCDPAWKVCTRPGIAAVKAPQCEPPAPASPRKSFGKVIQLSTGASASPTFEPTAALDKNGDLVVAYVAGLAVGSPNNIAVSKLNVAKDTVDGDHVLKLERENHFDPWMAADRKGKLYLAWLGFDGGGRPEKHMQVALATSDDGLNWSKQVVADDINTDCPNDADGCLDKPMIAIGPEKKGAKADAVYVFYYSQASNGLRATHSLDGGESFSPSVAVGDGALANADVTSSGKVHVVYVGGGGDDPNKMGDSKLGIYYTNSGDGGNNFSKPIKISGDSETIPFWFSNPQVLTDVERQFLYVIYPTGTPDGKWDIILAASDDGVKWKRATINDDGPCASHMVPTAILDPASGKIHVTWFDNRTGQGALMYTACASGGGKCAPNEQVSEAPFAAYGFARHSMHTLGEYNVMLIDPKKKLLHAVWTQPVEEGGKAVSRIFTASAKLK